MDTTVLKEIVELVKTISGDATSAVVIYILAIYITPLLQTIISFFGAYKIVQLILRIFRINIGKKEVK